MLSLNNYVKIKKKQNSVKSKLRKILSTFISTLRHYFLLLGTPDQIKMARQLIQEKIDNYVGGGMSGGSLGAPPSQGPPPGSYAPPPQVNLIFFNFANGPS